MLIDDQIKTTNKTATALYYENELGGLLFGESSFKVFSKPKKRTGPKSKNSPSMITEEVIKKLK